VSAEQTIDAADEGEADGEDRSAYAGVLRFYELAKRQEWAVRDLPWGDIPPVP
jgi:hypothetical protein